MTVIPTFTAFKRYLNSRQKFSQLYFPSFEKTITVCQAMLRLTSLFQRLPHFVDFLYFAYIFPISSNNLTIFISFYLHPYRRCKGQNMFHKRSTKEWNFLFIFAYTHTKSLKTKRFLYTCMVVSIIYFGTQNYDKVGKVFLFFSFLEHFVEQSSWKLSFLFHKISRYIFWLSWSFWCLGKKKV